MTKSDSGDDVTLSVGLVRRNITWVVIAIAGIVTWTETRITQSQHSITLEKMAPLMELPDQVANNSRQLGSLQQFLSPEKLKEFWRWQYMVERDIQELRTKSCK